MSLGGHILVFQADRELLAALIQNNTKIYGGAPPRAPLRLRLPPPPPPPSSGPIALHDPQSPADLIIKSVALELKPGTKSGVLLLNIDVGIIRLPDSPAVPLKGGRLRLDLEFQAGTFFEVKFTGATLETAAPLGAPNFVALANQLIARFLEGFTEERQKLFDELPEPYKTAVVISKPRVIDDNTVAVMIGSGNEAAVTRFLGPGASVSVGVDANRVRSAQLCRALLLPGEADPTWTPAMPGPTATEMARLPGGDCGTGVQSRSRDGVDVKITETRFAFRNGYIEITGTFDAEDICWSIENGRYSQKLFLDFNNVTNQIVPRLEPPEPVLDYDVSVDFLCEGLAVWLGLLVPFIGSIVLGIGFAVAVNMAAEAYNPSLPPTQFAGIPFAAIPGVRWMNLAIDPEGIFADGSMTVSVPSFEPQGRIWFDVVPQPQNLGAGGQGHVDYSPPMCAARTFYYQHYSQDDQKLIKAGHKWLIEPVAYRWMLNGKQLENGAEGELTFPTTVRTALPPPDGVDVPGFQVAMYFDTRSLEELMERANPAEIILRSRAEDLNYWVNLELRITDAVGRSFYFPEILKFAGAWVQFGPDYHEYVQDCLNKLGDYTDKKGKQARRPKPGEPQLGLSKYIEFVQEHVRAGNPEVVEFVPGLVKAHGLAAVNQAIARVAKRAL